MSKVSAGSLSVCPPHLFSIYCTVGIEIPCQCIFSQQTRKRSLLLAVKVTKSKAHWACCCTSNKFIYLVLLLLHFYSAEGWQHLYHFHLKPYRASESNEQTLFFLQFWKSLLIHIPVHYFALALRANKIGHSFAAWPEPPPSTITLYFQTLKKFLSLNPWWKRIQGAGAHFMQQVLSKPWVC